MMKIIVTAVLLAGVAQDKVELKPAFRKFDRLGISCTVKTEITSSTGRNSNYELELDLSSEVDEGKGDTAVFSCVVNGVRLKGTVDGREVDYDWSKRGGGRGTGPRGLEKALKQGWKLTLSGAKGFSVDDSVLMFGDALPIYNPGIFIGFAVPLPFGPVAEEGTWEVEGLRFPYSAGFGLNVTGTLELVKKDLALISGKLKFTKPRTEVPIEGIVNVRGEGVASMEYDFKAGRPKKGATSLKVYVAQGGLKRHVKQVIKYEVRP